MRPCGVISLQSLERVDSASLDECREYIVGCMESVRRLLAHSYREKKEEGGPLQMVIAFSLEKSGMANLELELLPFLLDLLKNHFPGMVGAVFILHYGWVHAGMWGLAKRVLPQQALDKIFFPSKDGLLEFFDADHLPRPFGGTLDVEIDESSNDVMSKFARPVFSSKKKAGQDEGKAAEGDGGGSANAGGDSSSDESWERNSAPPSPRGRSGVSSPALGYKKTLSRSGSFDSLVDEFYSTENTVSLALHCICEPLSSNRQWEADLIFHLQPWGSRRGTPKHSVPSTPRLEQMQHLGGGLPNMTPKAAQKLQYLQMTRDEASYPSSESRPRTKSTPTNPSSLGLLHDDGSAIPGRGGSQLSSRQPSRHGSPVQSRRGTLVGGQLPALLQQQRGMRNVHFTEKEDQGGPIRRVGSLRDFRLGSLTTPGEGQIGLEGGASGGGSGSSSSSGEGDESDSVESGKDGQKTDEVVDAKTTKKQRQKTNEASGVGDAERGFFARWRRGSRNVDAEATKASEKEVAYRKELMRQQHAQSKSPPSAVGPADAAAPPPLAAGEALPSPQLQVADLEEPPISGVMPLGPSFLSRRTRKFAAMPDHVSPYNASNPFYGYPAYPSSSPSSPKATLVPLSKLPRDGTSAAMRGGAATRGRGAFDLSTVSATGQYYPRHMHVRRRKRDLMRTLAYLFVLRLLSLHRSVRAQLLAVARQLARAFAVGGEEEGVAAADGEAKEERWKMAEERYRRLKLAGRRAEEDDDDYRQRLEASRRRMVAATAAQGRPLATLGIRKRYAVFFVLLVLLSRRRWRQSLTQGIDGLRLWIVAGAGRAVGGGLASDNAASEARNPWDTEEAVASVAAPSEDVAGSAAAGTAAATADSSYSSLTGLHLRHRLGIK